MNKKYKILLGLFLFGVIGMAGAFSIYFSRSIMADTLPIQYEVGGFLWNGNYGWISLSSKNFDRQNDPMVVAKSGVSYGVMMGADNFITGYGWSPNFGWVCFGSTCGQLAPDNMTASIVVSNENKLIGWANVLSLGDKGWIKASHSVATPASPGQICYSCQARCAKKAQICDEVDPPNCRDGECIEYSEIDYDRCGTCFASTYFDGTSTPPGTTGIVGGSGAICSGCTNCQKITSGLANRITCQSCSDTCTFYGVDRAGIGEELNDSFVGWGWSSDVAGDGVGWTNFNPSQGGAYVVYPWLETELSTLYAKNMVSQNNKSGINASYCIFANQIVRMISGTNCREQSLNIANLQQSPNGIYYNPLGKLDVAGLSTVKTGTTLNKYGQNVVEYSNDTWLGDKVLSGDVHHVSGDLTIGGNMVIKNNVINGSGTVIVEGNLNVNGDIEYDSASLPSDLKQLASVAWIVKGNVVINGAVKRMAGVFVVLGGDKEANKPGVFDTGISANPLDVFGLVIAKSFKFNRTYASIGRGSERIIYDGRLIANPPPGLTSFVQNMPVIRDFLY
ncbi:MAG: hypothetical protein WCL61_01670 [bacterium]